MEAREEEGVTVAYVTDPKTGTSFTFYEFEFELANQFNGQLTDDIIAWAVGNYETALTEEAIEAFGAKLAELGFLEPEGQGAAGTPGARPATDSGPSDSAEVEWNTAVPTSQYTPDAAMLKGGSGLTPAVQLDQLAQATKTERRPLPPPPEVESLAIELPPEALTELEGSGPTASGIPQRMLGSSSNPFSSSGGFGSKGIVERRQPPGPDSVVMTPFEDVSRRFRAPPPERQRSSTGIVVFVLLLLVGGGGGGYYYWLSQHPRLPEALRLRVVAPQPTAVYRWFASSGTVVDLESRTMAFDTAGKLVELMPSGTKFAAGDTLGKLQGAAALEGEVAKHKSKLAVFEQLRDSLKASGNKANLRDAEDKVVARKKVLDDTQASLAKLVLKAIEPGAILETPIKVGTFVGAKAPVLKWRGRSLHGDFTMDQEDFVKASKLEFCRVEVAGLGAPGAGSSGTPGGAAATPAPPPAPTAASTARPDGGASGPGELRYVDCTLPPPAPPPVNGIPNLLRKFIVTLPNEAGLVTGQQLHLARLRYDGVFALPVSAVLQETDAAEGKIWIAAPSGVAEPRTVHIAESRDEILVSRGINVGDEVIVEPPRDMTPGMLVEPIR